MHLQELVDQGLALGFKFRTNQGVMGLLQSRIKDCTSWLSRVSKSIGASANDPAGAEKQEEAQPRVLAPADADLEPKEPSSSLSQTEVVPKEHGCLPTSVEATQSLLTDASSLAVDMGKQELRVYAAWWECRARQLLEMGASDDPVAEIPTNERAQSVQLKRLLTELSRGQIANFVDKELLATVKTRSKEQQGWLRR